MDNARTQQLVEETWDRSILPTLSEYITIPNKSPAYDADWEAHGYVDKALALIEGWCRTKGPRRRDRRASPPRAARPCCSSRCPGDSDDDRAAVRPLRQAARVHRLARGPRAVDAGAGGRPPLRPRRRRRRLLDLRLRSPPCARCKEQARSTRAASSLIEGCEESGSFDLPYYLEALADRIGTPSLIVCLDSGVRQLRSALGHDLSARHRRRQPPRRAAARGRPLRRRLRHRRFELPRAAPAPRPHRGRADRRHPPAGVPRRRFPRSAWIRQSSSPVSSATVSTERFPLLSGVDARHGRREGADPEPTWRPALSITGAAGLPSLESAGNVLRPTTSRQALHARPADLRCHRCDGAAQGDPRVRPALRRPRRLRARPGRRRLERARYRALAARLRSTSASQAFFGARGRLHRRGRHASPSWRCLGEKFPQAQFLITGVLGPESNAHGPNEFLHVPTAKRLTSSVAQVIADHFSRPQ